MGVCSSAGRCFVGISGRRPDELAAGVLESRFSIIQGDKFLGVVDSN